MMVNKTQNRGQTVSGATTASSSKRALCQASFTTNHHGVSHHEPGWLLCHNDDDGGTLDVDQWKESPNLADQLEANDGTNNNVPTSLQMQCLKALAQALPSYIDACGVDIVHEMIMLLPSSTISALSVLCSCLGILTEDIVGVLGGHPHVEGLCLHAPSISVKGGQSALNDESIFSLVLSCGEPFQRCPPAALTILDACPAPRTELMPPFEKDDEDSSSEMETTPIKRLELVNGQEVSADVFSIVMQACPQITHLSISNSILPRDGRTALLDSENGVVALLPNLRVLDLSHCTWVTEPLLREFLLEATVPQPVAETGLLGCLEIVNVAGCPSISQANCSHLNQEFRGKPLVSIRVNRCYTA